MPESRCLNACGECCTWPHPTATFALPSERSTVLGAQRRTSSIMHPACEVAWPAHSSQNRDLWVQGSDPRGGSWIWRGLPADAPARLHRSLLQGCGLRACSKWGFGNEREQAFNASLDAICFPESVLDRACPDPLSTTHCFPGTKLSDLSEASSRIVKSEVYFHIAVV
jgi:hypothetical protein